MSKFFKYILLILLVCSCNKQDKIQNKVESADTSNVLLKDSVIPDTVSKIYEGLYTYNLSTNSFMDCNNPDSLYFVLDVTKKLAEMYKKTLTNPNVYGSVVAKLKGDVSQSSDEIKKEKYPKTFRVTEIISMEKKNFRNTCVSYDFWGLGNEPGWSLQISEKENLIEFYLPSEQKTYYFFYSEPKEDSGRIIYSSHNQIQRYIIDVILKKEKCSDTMSDNIYDYSVEVHLSGGKKFRGCGIKRNN
ncbi:MAG: hypothetical protein M3R36_17680 [Bacteroidota bacterium]|nr:hypothetical protein [Bacteroidota bacterium]